MESEKISRGRSSKGHCFGGDGGGSPARRGWRSAAPTVPHVGPSWGKEGRLGFWQSFGEMMAGIHSLMEGDTLEAGLPLHEGDR